MLHEPAAKVEKDATSDWKAKLGLKLFWVYCLVYVVFVAIAVFATDKMETIVFKGTNLAIMYGLGLIVLAIVMGLIYNYLCTKKEDDVAASEGNK